MALSAQEREKQMQQAEELLFSGPQRLGFAKALYFGHFNAGAVFPYPQLPENQRDKVARAVAEVSEHLQKHVDPVKIDREADIPKEVVLGLGRVGVLGMTVPEAWGGSGLSQYGYCKIMELIGAHDAAVVVFVNAHHSIGLRALLLWGTPEQQETWLRPLVKGEKLAAFALTEPEAGSDAANVQATAMPTPDGQGFVLNGEKRYITNGGIADVLTVMARTPVPGKEGTHVSAFLVTPDMPGFEVLEARMPKLGIRGTATGRMRFTNVFVPRKNVLGELGRGLKMALTVLDFGRTTFGASCTGAQKFLLKHAIAHANTRRQFGQSLGEFELVKKKLARMAANCFAMESATYHCAAQIDSGAEDYMLETAILKVFSTEALWEAVNDTIQIYGGKAYFCDQPFERMLRDARINQIGEGANDVLRHFIIGLAGMRGPGMGLKGVLDALYNPLSQFGTLLKFGRNRISNLLTTPEVPVRNALLQPEANELGKRVREFGKAVQSVLIGNREEIVDRQYVTERIADAGMELYVSGCVISRLDGLLANGAAEPDRERDLAAGRYYLRSANRRIRQNLESLWDNDDELTTKTANVFLGKSATAGNGKPAG